MAYQIQYNVYNFILCRCKVKNRGRYIFLFWFFAGFVLYTYFHKLRFVNQKLNFHKKHLPDVCIKTILWLVSKRNGFIFYKYKLYSNKMVIISTHQTLFSTKSYINSFSFGNDELDAWIEHHRLFRKPLSIAINRHNVPLS